MTIFDKSTLTRSGFKTPKWNRFGRRGIAPVEMTIVLVPLMLMMAAIIAFGLNACWKLRTEIVARDVVWRDRHPHENHWSANEFVRNPEFSAPREGRTVDDGSGRLEHSEWRTIHDRHLSTFDDEEVTNAPIIRGPIPNINVNSELLNYSRGVEMGTTKVLRKPNILSKMGQIEFESWHSFLGDSFQYGHMNLRSEDSQYYHGFYGWSNYPRRIPYIYETEMDYVTQLPAYLNAISQVEAVRIPFCLAIDEEALYYAEYARYSDRHPRVRRFSSTDRTYVREHYIEGDRGVKLRITGGVTSKGRRVHGVPYSVASKFISIWSSRMVKATTIAEREFYKTKIQALKLYQQSVK